MKESPLQRWLPAGLLGFAAGAALGFAARGFPGPARRGGGLLRQEEDDDAAPPDEERPTCEPQFLFHRQDAEFYNDTTGGRVNEVRACDAPAALQVPERVSIPIYWAVVGGQWTVAQAQEKMDEAIPWFERYCIFLTVAHVQLRRFEAAALQADLRRGDTGDPDRFAAECKRVYKRLWSRAGRPQHLLVILFLDAFQAVRYERGGRVNRVAGNFRSFPLILIPGDPDRRSRHIVTHELIHGLGKERNPSASPPTTSVPGSGPGRINTWDEAGCTNDMGNAERQQPAAPLVKDASDRLDWASYHQFLKVRAIV